MSWADALSSSFLIPKPTLTEDNLPSQSGRVFIVTGGYAGVGKQLCRILYQRHGTVYIAGRSKEKADRAISEIRNDFPNSDGRVEFLLLDLADLPTVKISVDQFLKREARLDVLINNAGVMNTPIGTKTIQGFEVQMGTNCLGHYLFTQLLTPLLEKTATTALPNSVRVCWAASLAIFAAPPNGMLWDDTTASPKVVGVPMKDYFHSKVGNVWLARQYQAQTSKAGIVSLAFNPGNLHSDLQRHQGWVMWAVTQLLAYPTKYGAYTELWAGWSEEAGRVEHRNKYVGPWGRWKLVRRDIEQSEQQEKFLEYCERETRVYR